METSSSKDTVYSMSKDTLGTQSDTSMNYSGTVMIDEKLKILLPQPLPEKKSK